MWCGVCGERVVCVVGDDAAIFLIGTEGGPAAPLLWQVHPSAALLHHFPLGRPMPCRHHSRLHSPCMFVYLYFIPIWGFPEFLRLMLQYPTDRESIYCWAFKVHTILTHNYVAVLPA